MAGRFLIPPAMRTSFAHKTPKMSEIKDQAGKDIDKIGGYLKDNYNPKDPLFKKDEKEGRSINNLWTGYKLGGKGKLLVTGSVLGGGTLMVSNARGAQVNNNVKAASQEQDIESLQSTRSDSLAYQASIGTAALQDLSASGDLVFAMHRTRHTGQL